MLDNRASKIKESLEAGERASRSGERRERNRQKLRGEPFRTADSRQAVKTAEEVTSAGRHSMPRKKPTISIAKAGVNLRETEPSRVRKRQRPGVMVAGKAIATHWTRDATQAYRQRLEGVSI